MDKILGKLEGSDRRSIGKSNEVVMDVLKNPTLFKDVIQCMHHDDPVVRMRAADVVEKITAQHPEYLKPYKKKLIDRIAGIEQQEVRWHMAQIFPRLNLSLVEQKTVINILYDYLKDKSNIVKVFSLQALSDFAVNDNILKKEVINLLHKSIITGSAAVKNRSTKLLQKLMS